MHQLLDTAERRGLTVEWVDLGSRNGEYECGTIRINPNRLARTQRWTLAHELGHAWHDHEACHHDAARAARQEREADAHAAMLLVDEFTWRAAEREFSEAGIGAVANELEVPQRFVERMRELERGLHGGWPPICEGAPPDEKPPTDHVDESRALVAAVTDSLLQAVVFEREWINDPRAGDGRKAQAIHERFGVNETRHYQRVVAALRSPSVWAAEPQTCAILKARMEHRSRARSRRSA
ncbi:MAG: ImmA/IrrE family metallo-endopeptidase [Streptomycetaceae bacterium]|nr:ImmA/IrrE family metallo-endopeptidase [Streptomycetaceae bacterium]NUS54756.1 ImmA/IrrE family metallo-endopeptidase [Streptomycetaceae bacterium]